MIVEVTTKTEKADGSLKVTRTKCYGAEAVAEERAHQRAMAPTGSSQVITLRQL
jgi:hypothetical protein